MASAATCLRLSNWRNRPSSQRTAAVSGPIPFSRTGMAAGEGASSLAGLSKASRSASTVFNCSSRTSSRSSSRIICAFRRTGRGRPSPVRRSASYFIRAPNRDGEKNCRRR